MSIWNEWPRPFIFRFENVAMQNFALKCRRSRSPHSRRKMPHENLIVTFYCHIVGFLFDFSSDSFVWLPSLSRRYRFNSSWIYWFLLICHEYFFSFQWPRLFDANRFCSRVQINPSMCCQSKCNKSSQKDASLNENTKRSIT